MEDRWNPETFCEKHGEKTLNKQEIEPINEEEFISFFKECLELYFSLIRAEKEKSYAY